MFAGIPGQDFGSLVGWIVHKNKSPWPVGVREVPVLCIEVFKLVIFAAPVGWAIQTILVALGFRISRVPDLQEAANYDDRILSNPETQAASP
jgi:hypothetical protein